MGIMRDYHIYKAVVVCLFFLGYCQYAFAQEEFDDFKQHQPSMIGVPQISADGNWAVVSVSNPVTNHQTLILKQVETEKEFVLSNTQLVGFTKTGKWVVTKAADTLFLYPFVGKPSRIFKIKNAKLNGNYLLYQELDKQDRLTIRNIGTDYIKYLKGIQEYLVLANDRMVILTDSASLRSIKIVNLNNLSIKTIWSGRKEYNPQNIVWSNDYLHFAFTTHSKDKRASIWVYNPVQSIAEVIYECADTNQEVMPVGFRNKDRNLIIQVSTNDQAGTPNMKSKVDVYSYTDKVLQSEQLYQLTHNIPKTNIMSIKLSDSKTSVLQNDTSVVLGNLVGEMVLIATKHVIHQYEWNWNKAALQDVYLYSLESNRKICIKKDVPEPILRSFQLSPDQQYVCYYDPLIKGYCSYEIKNGKTHLNTNGVQIQWTDYDRSDEPSGNIQVNGISRFTDKGRLLIQGRNQIAIIDPSGKRKSVILPGSDKDIQLRPAEGEFGSILKENDPLLLNGFDRATKKNGYFRIKMSDGKVQRLSMLPYLFMGAENYDPPIHIPGTSKYLVSKQDVGLPPEYDLTQDFSTFKPFFKVNFDGHYQIGAELISWKSGIAGQLQGVLYKPRDYDVTKTYPLIVTFYERLSNDLHRFAYPKATNSQLDIAYFVNQGYLVFTPDIAYRLGYPGASAYECVMGGIDELLKTNKSIDPNRIGIQGHSFGGFETNYIITHTNRFAAAMSSSGMTDFISAYGSIIGDGSSRQRQYELYRDRINGNLWDSTAAYIRNSPVLLANKIQTPILMMCNHHDEDVPYTQGMEFFTALRRLGKRAWLLQYDLGSHFAAPEDEQDLTHRILQFFDHYLKGRLAPTWMTRGIPASNKGKDNGFTFDNEIKTPIAGVLTLTSQSQVDSLSGSRVNSSGDN